jgi:hypothetical protein
MVHVILCLYLLSSMMCPVRGPGSQLRLQFAFSRGVIRPGHGGEVIYETVSIEGYGATQQRGADEASKNTQRGGKRSTTNSYKVYGLMRVSGGHGHSRKTVMSQTERRTHATKKATSS